MTKLASFRGAEEEPGLEYKLEKGVVPSKKPLYVESVTSVTEKSRIGEFIRFAKKINEEYGGWEKAESGDGVATLSWRKIVHDWLPQTKREPVDPPPLPEGVFNVIYADPPWQYEFSPSERGDPERHYPTLSTEDICALEVPVAEDAILFLWASNPKLEEAFEVIKAWGLKEKTHKVR